MLLAKTELNTIAVLISAAWIDSYINHNEFVSVNNVLQKYNDMKEEIKICENCASFKKNTTNENSNFKETNQNELLIV